MISFYTTTSISTSVSPAEGRRYKDYRLYSCFVLNFLVSALGINLYQEGLEKHLDEILRDRPSGVTKDDIRHELQTNHKMTNKVLSYLEKEGYITIHFDGRRYDIRITKAGVLHVREFNRYYKAVYDAQIRDQYRYRGLPSWYRDLE
jgi:predicted transcriptional regulator